MTDREIIEKVAYRIASNERWQKLDIPEGNRYETRVLARYARWLERAKWQPKPDESRLLNDEEMKPYWAWVDDGDGYNQRQDFNIKALLEAQRDLTAPIARADERAKVLREVGEWVDGRCLEQWQGLTANPITSCPFYIKDIETLKKGELP